jgi:hypothetical protein
LPVSGLFFLSLRWILSLFITTFPSPFSYSNYTITCESAYCFFSWNDSSAHTQQVTNDTHQIPVSTF